MTTVLKFVSLDLLEQKKMLSKEKYSSRNERKNEEEIRVLPMAVAAAPDEHLVVNTLNLIETSVLGLQTSQLLNPKSIHIIAMFSLSPAAVSPEMVGGDTSSGGDVARGGVGRWNAAASALQLCSLAIHRTEKSDESKKLAETMAERMSLGFQNVLVMHPCGPEVRCMAARGCSSAGPRALPFWASLTFRPPLIYL